MLSQESIHQSRVESDTDLVSLELRNDNHPVVLFSLSWCGFCRSAKQLLQQLGVSYHLIELDSGQFSSAALREIRQQLQARTGSRTLPQLFIAGQSIGGYTETHRAWKQGQLEQLLQNQGIATTSKQRN
ncbi:MAG: glutaredoxin [Pseudomonadales bacterium]|nr:glutaredoxin [Pseudomonadales bacterium]